MQFPACAVPAPIISETLSGEASPTPQPPFKDTPRFYPPFLKLCPQPSARGRQIARSCLPAPKVWQEAMSRNIRVKQSHQANAANGTVMFSRPLIGQVIGL